ncbi:arginine deiminase-related protein, partial [Bacteroidota bacterium]
MKEKPFMFTKAIVRIPCQNLQYGLTSSDLGMPHYERAVIQHSFYIQSLIECGLEVYVLEADNEYPDSVFVEDVALLTPNCAIITFPGAKERRGEINIMKDVLGKYYSDIETIKFPGTVEAGDIMMVGDHYYIGLSERTNIEGANQMITFLEKYGMTGSFVALDHVLHLKTGVSYIENGNMVVCGEFIHKPEFQQYNLIEVDDDES